VRFSYSVENGDHPEVVLCERLGQIAYQLERIADHLEEEECR